MALGKTVGEIAGTLLSIVHTRIELFSLEASGQKTRLVKVLGMACAALFFLALAVVVATITVALYFWPTEHRYLALWLLALLYALLGCGFFWAVRRNLASEPVPFAATLDELQRDIALAGRLQAESQPEALARARKERP
jgi:uncharacterized membrane protein YqjE